MTVYILCWEFGTHHINVETNKKDFHRIIDDMSTEFEIHKTYDDIDCPDATNYTTNKLRLENITILHTSSYRSADSDRNSKES